MSRLTGIPHVTASPSHPRYRGTPPKVWKKNLCEPPETCNHYRCEALGSTSASPHGPTRAGSRSAVVWFHHAFTSSTNVQNSITRHGLYNLSIVYTTTSEMIDIMVDSVSCCRTKGQSCDTSLRSCVTFR